MPMVSRFLCAALTAVQLFAATQVWAASAEEERLLGSDRESEQRSAYLPFTRSIGASGLVAREQEQGLAESTAAAGVPAAAMLEAIKAFAVLIDLDKDVRRGDRFYVRYEQAYTIEGAPIETGRVLWAELQLSGKRTVGIYRFQPRNGREELWSNSGQGTADPQLRMPVDDIVISSGFGLRVDPFDQPAVRGMGMGPLHTPVLPPSPLMQHVNTATPLGQSLGLTPNAYVGAFAAFAARGRSSGGMAMHEGVDLVAPPGTPIHAAGDGVVKGAEPKGRYGNWVEIEHEGKLATVYGHLSSFAPGIACGVEVHQGDVIGYVGTTGRTTGPHVHFEVLANGRPTNPITSPAVKHPQLQAADLVAFRKLMAQDQAERQREEKAR
jgi:murein DD-endopeptidase MepM/ murein hydrolase activator NlpD